MATFYVLPPRSCLEDLLTSVLGRLLPGLPLPADGWDLLLVHLAANSGWSRDLFLVPRDDLPEGEPLEESLRIHFGAEPGDRVVEVPLPRATLEKQGAARAWTVKPVGVSSPGESLYNHSILGPRSAAISDAG